MSRIRNITIVCIGIYLILISVLPMVTGKIIDRFGTDGLDTDVEYTIHLEKEEDIGLEATGCFAIPSHRGEIKNASLKIKCMSDEYNNYLTDPKLDVGLEWGL